MPLKGRKPTTNMFINNKSVFLALLTLTALLLREGSGVAGHLNVFLNPEEVMRLLGKWIPPTPPIKLISQKVAPFVIDFSTSTGKYNNNTKQLSN